MADGVYQRDPEMAPDSDFEPGELAHLVPGNEGRLLDPRRTPVRVIGLDLPTGYFTVELLAFEDAGARWVVELERVWRYQFARGATRARDDDVEAMRDAVARLDQTIAVDADPQARVRTLARLEEERAAARAWLGGADVRLDLTARVGDPATFALLRGYLAEREVLDLEEAFSERYVSNPGSGELVKGHRLVIAELGLVPYRGKIVRNPTLFDGAWSAERRAAHAVARLAFVSALYRHAGHECVELWRGIAVAGPLRRLPPATFVSATFAREVAESLFSGGGDTDVAVLYRQLVPVERLFMTYAETEAMSRHFRESEAVLLGDPVNLAF
jgi:hypothetical protein